MRKKRLGEILLDAGVIKPAQLAEALEDQKRYGGKLGMILLERRLITEREFFHALSSQLSIPAVDFTKSTIPEAVIKVLPQELAEKHVVFPVAVKRSPAGNTLVLAMSDPTNVQIQDEVRFTTGCKVEPVLALESTIRYVINDYFYHGGGKGSYRMRVDLEAEAPAPSMETQEFHVEHATVAEVDDPELMMPPPTDNGAAQSKDEDKPRLTRELKALLKLLGKKGIITPKEYLDEFKDTE
jgi:type IV pilus assembly protein PilB